MFTAKFLPNTAELKKKHQTKDHVYSEVFNGQIEVVKEISQLRLSKVKGVVWEVICYPRSSTPGARGTRFLIHRGLHVDPSKIVSAWAVTSNKSMGGECENVGVFVPPGIEKSLFDRSNVYVAFSRPTKFLGVIGQPRDIKGKVLAHFLSFFYSSCT
jgi:ATP-dependent exoDNAse (exonuclease V) alpha subunit